MADIATSLVSRYGGLATRSLVSAVDELFTKSSSALTRRDETGGPDNSPLSGLYLILFIVAVVLGVSILELVQYPINLLLTLAIVESPPAVYLPLESEDAETTIGSAPTPHLTRQGDERIFVTSSIRRTLKHLKQQGGFFAPWRGIVPSIFFAIANSFARGFFVSILAILFPVRLASILGGVASIVALSRFALVVTHIKISSPQPGVSWWTRLGNTTWAQAKGTIPALVVFAVASQVAIEFAILSNNPELGRSARFGIISSDLLAFFFLVLPANVLLTRVQASVLADDVSTVVPFDKTFGQDTSSTNGVLTLQMALNSLDFDICKRLGIFFLKTIPLFTALCIGFVILLFVQIGVISGGIKN
ncbi:hypothetical protein DFH27DRAFT_652461 [Peziza echinospora]|nr:hypothetical protein DFH27DRAFT_652461 [Peziza echinospora]